MSDRSRRFTDREVAVILRKASEIEEKEGRVEGGGGGLSLQDLLDIAREVGISPDAMDRAVRELGRRSPPPGWAGAPLVRRAVHVVEGELDRSGIARLMHLVDDRADGAGSLTEALGAVRWTSDDRFSTTQVSVTPADGRTRVEVVEKVRPRVRRLFHLLPAAWGAMLAGPVVASLGPSAGVVAVGLAAGVAGGVALGRLAWTIVSARSEARVSGMAEALSSEAEK
jgi:hypothetical protein